MEGTKETEKGQKEKREIRVTFATIRPEGDRHYQRGERGKSGNSKQRQAKKQEKPSSASASSSSSSPRRKSKGVKDSKEETNTTTTKSGRTSSVVVKSSEKTLPARGWGDVVKGKSTSTAKEVKKSTPPPATAETKKATKSRQKQQQQQQQQPSEIENALKKFAASSEKTWNPSDLYLRKALLPTKSGSLRNQLPKIASYIRSNKSLKRVTLSHNALDDNAMKILCSELAHSTVKVLDLSYNDIGVNGAKYLGSVLSKKNCTIVELNLNENALCGDGVDHLARALETNTSLKTLQLERNYLDNQATKAIGLILLKNKSLERLDVSRALFDKSEGYDEIAKGLLSNTTMKCIRLRRCKLGPNGARAISNALANNEKSGITDIDVRERRPPTELLENFFFDFFSSFISSLSLHACLSFFVSQYSTQVNFNKIGVLGAKEFGSLLSKNKMIEKLSLQYNNIGVEGARHIATGLENNGDVKCIGCELQYH